MSITWIEEGAALSKAKNRKRKGDAGARGVTAHAVRVALGRKLAGEAVQLAEQLVAKRPSSEHRVLLGEAILMRLGGMVSGKLDAELAARLVRRLDDLAADLEEADRERFTREAQGLRGLLLGGPLTAEADPRTLHGVVDGALRNPDLLSRLSPEIAGEVTAVSDGLRALEQGDHQAGLSAVAAIGFRSPLAPWRIFIRGLAHYYDGAIEQAIETWSRLPSDRPPRRIARALLALESHSLGDDPPPSPASMRRLQTALDKSSGDSLADLRRAWMADEPYRMVVETGRLWRARRDDVDWLQRLSDRVWSHVAASGDARACEEMKRQFPLPCWDRDVKLAAALTVLLHPQWHDPAELTAAVKRLEGYFAGLDENVELSEADRLALRAVVAQRLAHFYRGFYEFASETRRGPKWIRGREASFATVGRELTLRLLQRASEASPGWDEPVELAERILRADDGDPEPEVIAVFQRYAGAHPERVDALRRYGEALRRTDHFQEAARVLETLERIAPRDPWVRAAGWHQRMQRVRRMAIEGDFDAAIATANELGEFRPEDIPPFVLDLLRAAVEFKRKDAAAAMHHLRAARRQGIGKAALAMLMEVHAVRMKLPADAKRMFRQLGEEAVKKEKEPKEAAELARLMAPVLLDGEKYSGAVTHRRDMLKYIRRCLTVKLAAWTPEWVRDIGVAVFRMDEENLEEAIYIKFRRSMAREPIIRFFAGLIDEDVEPIGSYQWAIEESQRRPEVALPKEMLEFARKEQTEWRREPAGLGGFRADLDDDDDTDMPDEFWDIDPSDMFELSGLDVAEVERKMQEAVRKLEKEARKARTPAEMRAAAERSVASLPPVLQRMMIAQLCQRMGAS